MTTDLIGCSGCGISQELPASHKQGRLECWRCGHVLERCARRSIDAPLACSIATLLLLLPANYLTLITVNVAGVSDATYLASGVLTFWQQGWPVMTIVLGLQGIILPFLRFGLLSGTLMAIRSGVRGPVVGALFRYAEILDRWAMVDVLAIGFGVGYGRIASQIPVTINIGGWCFLGAALLTMVTRGCMDRRAIWRALAAPSASTDPDAITCTDCDLVLPPEMDQQRCLRCAAQLHRRRPFANVRCAALVIACWLLMPLAYWLPMTELWEADMPHPISIINGIELLVTAGFWPLAILISLASVGIPFGKLIGLTWLLTSVHLGSRRALRGRTHLYNLINAIGRWSNMDPFSVMIFAPMVRFGQLAHIEVKGGSLAFLAMVVLSMVAAQVFDPRLMWDAAGEHADAAALARGQ